MIIYFDENISPHVAHGINLLQHPRNIGQKASIEVKALADVFGRGSRDEDWIPEAGKEAACILTQDIHIQRIRHQRVLCEQFGLGMFFLRPPSKRGLNYWDMVQLIVRIWPELTEKPPTMSARFHFKLL